MIGEVEWRGSSARLVPTATSSMMFTRRDAGVVRAFQTRNSATQSFIYQPDRLKGDEDRKAVGVDKAW